MGRILCWLGLHKWENIKRKLSYWDERHDVHDMTDQCKRCHILRTWYDTGE